MRANTAEPLTPPTKLGRPPYETVVEETLMTAPCQQAGALSTLLLPDRPKSTNKKDLLHVALIL